MFSIQIEGEIYTYGACYTSIEENGEIVNQAIVLTSENGTPMNPVDCYVKNNSEGFISLNGLSYENSQNGLVLEFKDESGVGKFTVKENDNIKFSGEYICCNVNCGQGKKNYLFFKRETGDSFFERPCELVDANTIYMYGLYGIEGTYTKIN